MAAKKPPAIPLPKSWTKHVRTAMLHVISLARYAADYTRSWAADSTNGRSRFLVQLATTCLATVLALLPVGSRRSGSLFQTRHGHHRIQNGTERCCCSAAIC